MTAAVTWYLFSVNPATPPAMTIDSTRTRRSATAS
jgi:hypothetical protein